MPDYEEFNDDITMPDSLEEFIAQTFRVGNLTLTIQQGNLAKYIALGVYYDAIRLINRLVVEKNRCKKDAESNMDEGNYRKVATLADLLNGMEEQIESMQDNNNELYLTMKQLSWIE